MINNELYNNIRDYFSEKREPDYLRGFLSISPESYNVQRTTGEKSFFMLNAHKNASGLEYFSGSEVTSVLKKLADNQNEEVNMVVGGGNNTIVMCYFNGDFSDCWGFLSFVPYLKSESEVKEEKRVLGISDED